jgi:hypothetical protein
MGEGANRKDAPNTSRPPPTKALAVCLNTLPNIQNTNRQDRISAFEWPTEPRRAALEPESSPNLLRTWRLLTKRTTARKKGKRREEEK